MKKMNCAICDEPHVVDDEVEKVTCGDCLMAGFAYDTPKSIWITLQQLRDEGLSLREIERRFRISHTTVWRHTVPLGCVAD